MLLLLMTSLFFAKAGGDDAPAVSVRAVGSPRRIVTDAGAGGYQAFPDVCRLKNGDLFCVFYAGYTHVSQPTDKLPRGGRICAVRSQDEGKTWSTPSTIIDTPDDDRDPSVCCLPDGTLLCNFFTYDKNTAYDTCVSRSTDGGATWSTSEAVLPSYATSSPIRRLRSGRLLLPIYCAHPNDKRSFAAFSYSDDKGRTWSAPHPIGLKAGLTLDETDVYERKDGTLLAVMREVMATSESQDKGITWSPVHALGFKGHCPYLLSVKAGKQMVLLMAHRLPQTSLHYSTDEGRTWQGPVLIDSVIGAYPSLVQLRNGHVLCVYYEEGSASAIRAVEIEVR